MKTALMTILITLSLNIYGQNNSIYKTWIGSSNEYFKVTDSYVYFDYGYYMEKFTYNLTQDSFILIDNSRSYNKELHTAPFKIIKLTSDSLVLKPLSNYAKRLSDNNETFNFVDSANIYDQDFKFERIFFSGTACFGNCPGMKLEIDSVGNMFFFGEYHTGKYKGLYRGKLSLGNLNKLIEILKWSLLDNFPTQLGGAIDAPTYNFVFSYNGKKKESEGSFIPYYNQELLIFLLECYKSSNLKKVNRTQLNPFFLHRNYHLLTGDYRSANGYPNCNMEILNDSIILINSSSIFYFHEIGQAKYIINDRHISIDFSENPIQISNLDYNNNDSIILEFNIFDKKYDEPLPFANISVINHTGDTIVLSTDFDGHTNIKIKKSTSLLHGTVSYVGFHDLTFNVIPNCSKQILINFENKKRHYFTIKRVSKKKCYLINDDNVNLVLEKIN